MPVTVPLAAPCPTCRGTGAKPGTTPTVCSRLPGPRRRGRVAGPLLDLPAVPRLRRHRHRDQGPVPDLQRQRPDAPGQALQGEHPRGRARRQPRAARRQGRGRPARRPARRPLRDHARGREPDLQAQGRQPRGGRADHDRRGDQGRDGRGAHARPARSGSACPPAPSTAPSSACAARARRGWAARAAATSTTGSRSRCRARSRRSRARPSTSWQQVMNGNPRERLFSGRDELMADARATAAPCT